MEFSFFALVLVVGFVFVVMAITFYGGLRGLEKKFSGLEREIVSLKRRLFALEKKTAGAQEAARVEKRPEGAAPPPLPVQEMSASPRVPPAAASPAERPHATLATGRSFGPAERAARPEGLDLEQRIGARWATWVGIVAIVFSMAFLLRWTFENDIIGPAGRVLLGLATGLLLLAGGLVLHRRGTAPFLADGLVGGGLGILYLSLFAAHHFYQFIEASAAFALMFLVTMAGSGIAIATRRQAMAVLAILGGLLTPILISTENPDERKLLGYLIVLNLLVLGVSRYRSWPALNRLAWTGSVVLFLPVLTWHPNAPEPTARLTLMTVLYGIFLVVPLLQAWMEKRRAEPIDLAFVVCNAAAYFGAVYITLDRWRPDLQAPWALGLAVLYVLVAARYRYRVTDDEAGVDIHLGTAAVFLTISVPIALDGPWVTLGWAAQGVVLIALAPKMPRAITPIVGGVIVLLFATVRAALLDYFWEMPAVRVWNIGYLVHLLVVAALALAGLLATRIARVPGGGIPSGEGVRTSLWAVGSILLGVLLWIEPSGLWPATMLTLELLTLAALARWQGDRAFVVVSPLLALAVVIRIWVIDAGEASAAAIDLINAPLILRVGACVALAVAGGWLARSPAPIDTGAWSALLRGTGGVLLLVALSQDWYQHKGFALREALRSGAMSLARDIRWSRDVGMSILWTCYAALALAGGFLRDRSAVRYASLSLFGVVILKVFFIDMSELEAIYRILSFLVLGLVLLGVSALYQRMRSAPHATRL